MKQNLFTIQEVSSLLGVSTKTLRRWEESGIIKPMRTAGNQRRYRLAEIKKLQRRRSLLRSKKEVGREVFAEGSKVVPDTFKSVQDLPSEQPVSESITTIEEPEVKEAVPSASFSFMPLQAQNEVSVEATSPELS